MKFFGTNFWTHCVLCFLGFTFGALSIHIQPSIPKSKNMKYKILFVFYLKEVTSIGKNDALLALSVTSSCQHYTWTEPAKILCC